MSQSSSTFGGRNWRVVTYLLLAAATLQSGCLFLAFSLMAPPLTFMLPVALMVVSVGLYRWLCFRGTSELDALFCTALALLASPWTTWLLIAWSDGILPGSEALELAFLFGPLLPYGLIAAGGLGRRPAK